MDHQQIFSTNIFIIDEFIIQKGKGSQGDIDIENMKKYISNLWAERDYDDNWQTKSADLHTKPEFKRFASLVKQYSKQICRTLDYDVEDIVITDMWANVLKTTEHHNVHTHSNNFLSGTYYLQSDQASSIVFHDPRPQADVIVPKKKKTTPLNSSLLSYASKTNRAIIFPSWLPHWVQQNKSANKRISIAWNIQVKGQVGEHHEFQSANF
jgi:uncharacterized protein (TIGR02466 family)|tara:strand:+ start:1245 stop:1874 length:630 start_codon:yes stop_codon:yes gene_type:complete